jgi:hypothetical protein
MEEKSMFDWVFEHAFEKVEFKLPSEIKLEKVV